MLCYTNWSVKKIIATLSEAGIETINLENYDGKTRDCVKVGTIKRAKGLEFKHVLLADVRNSWLATGEKSGKQASDHISLEKEILRRRELYVAMTRARDGLWLGVMSST